MSGAATRREVGTAHENAAAAYLARHGLQVIAQELFRSRSTLQAEASNITALDNVLLPLVEDAQLRGELRSDHSAELLAGMIRNVYLMAVLEWLGQDQIGFAVLAERSLRLVLEGLE